MKKTHLLGLLLWPLAVTAQTDYAWQWPLELSEPDAGVHEITLSEEVYRIAWWRDLRDVRVLDADGRVVDSARYPAPEVATGTQSIELPWFPLPADTRADADLELVVQRNASGRVTSIRETGTRRASATDPAWLVDLDEHAGQVRALHVEWSDPDASFDLGYRVETSTDLRNWRVLESEVRLVQLHNDQRQLRRNQFALSTGAQQRYLRLVPLQSSGAPALNALRGEMDQSAENDDWQWLDLSVQRQGEEGFEYHTSGFFPVQRLDVTLPANSSLIWRVSNADPGNAGQQPRPWRVRVERWETRNVQMAGEAQRSAPLQLPSDGERNRHWRLQPASGALPPVAPVLRIGWRPERLVFLAQGRAPYHLVVGNARAQEDRAHGAGVIALRGDAIANDRPWQPGQAHLGERQIRAGEIAYQPALDVPEPRDWKTWILWAILIAGSGIVVWFALSVLRARPTPDTGEDSAQ